MNDCPVSSQVPIAETPAVCRVLQWVTVGLFLLFCKAAFGENAINEVVLYKKELQASRHSISSISNEIDPGLSDSSIQQATHPVLKQVPVYFFERGYFSDTPSSYLSASAHFLLQDIAFPTATVAASSFALGFLHRGLLGKVPNPIVAVLGIPTLNLVYHALMKPEASMSTAVRLLPDMSDALLTAAFGPQWAGAATSWLRTANHLFAATQALWPEISQEAHGFQSCQSRPILYDDSIDSHSLPHIGLHSCLPAHLRDNFDNQDLPHSTIINLHLKAATSTASSSHPFLQRLLSLQQQSQIQGIDQLILLPYSANTFYNSLRIIPLRDNAPVPLGSHNKEHPGWSISWPVDPHKLNPRRWWTTLLKTPGQVFQWATNPLTTGHPSSNPEYASPLSSTVIETITGVMIAQPHGGHTDINTELGLHTSEPARDVAGLLLLPIEDNLNLWFRRTTTSLLPGTYEQLPEVVLQTSSVEHEQLPELEDYRIKQVIPPSLELPWRTTQYLMMNMIQKVSAHYGEKLVKFLETVPMFPGIYMKHRSLGNLFSTASTVNIPTHDGKELSGFLVPATTDTPKKDRTLLLFYHANGATAQNTAYSLLENFLSSEMTTLKVFCNQNDIDAVFPEYRGYQNNLNPVDVETFERDALSFYNHLSPGYKRTVVAGHSLGAAAALSVAAESSSYSPPDITLPIAPFYTVHRAGQHLFTQFLPEWLVRYNFRNDKNITRINRPVHLFHGERDKMIPVQHSKDLFQLCAKQGQPCRLWLLKQTGHNDIMTSNILIDTLKQALLGEPLHD